MQESSILLLVDAAPDFPRAELSGALSVGRPLSARRVHLVAVLPAVVATTFGREILFLSYLLPWTAPRAQLDQSCRPFQNAEK